ncbi:MAG TPA: Gfo/Idh/MocA family oxidoreductase [Tepidisphaeraceae bacterium]|nr:Gfo/Idh/MocA family oxidoreductase [Tepidisphaeraceae bacterium]
MLRVGVIGLGMMGVTHLDVYSRRTDARVVAVADVDPARRSGKALAAGNVPGQAQGGFDYASAAQYADGMELIRDPQVEVVDVCLATPLHRRFAVAAMEAGKHVLVEKPLARTSADAAAIADAAQKAGVIAMPAMCMRFWPGWTWLKSAIVERRYGNVLAAHFRRLASHPGGPFYTNGAASGGAALDLHIHDVDFIQYCFGAPRSVSSRGYSNISGATDHMLTAYHYDNIPLVTAEGSWNMQAGFPFQMQYIVNFEHATAVYDLLAAQKLVLYQDKQPHPIELDPAMGYEHEIAYFLQCVREKRQPTTVTLTDAANAVRIVECEVESIATGRVQPFAPLGASSDIK